MKPVTADGAGNIERLRAFMREHVTTLEQLEALVLLHRHPGETWTAARVAAHLGWPEDEVRAALLHLAGKHLLRYGSAEGRFEYRPAPHLQYIVSETCRAYRAYPTAVIEVLASNSMLRARTEVVKAFADAFILAPGLTRKGP
jgi:hypothetical protein